jgi:hypothetical protein
MPTIRIKNKIQKSILHLEKWIEDNEFKGYEPFDGLSSILYPTFTLGNLLLERVLQQSVRQSPINLRPLLGIKPQESTKGMGYIAWGYLKMFRATQKEFYKQKTIECLQWLDENKSPLYEEYSWGNHFEYSSRGGRIPKHTSTIVWTSLIGMVYLEAYKLFNVEKYLDIAISICSWILKLSRLKSDHGFCISYTARRGGSTIHNSNMLGASMLSKTANITGNQEYLAVAKEAMKYSCADQLADGAWYYGVESKFHWIDNFHTGYNLDSLKRYIDSSGDMEFDDNLKRGYKYFKNRFFEDTGRPKYYHNRAYPIDIQCASQAIDTLVLFSDNDETAIKLACRVADWTIDNMQDKSGYFYYRILPLMKVKIPMIHWGQATMFKALANLLLKLNSINK